MAVKILARLTRSVCATLVCAFLPVVVVGAAPGPSPATSAVVEDLMRRDLTSDPHREALLLTVEYQPGGASLPHRHDAQVFVYVLQGEMTMQVDGSPRVTLRAGETFYEGTDDIHRISANASRTAPAKILVFIIKDKGKPDSRAVDEGRTP